MEYFVIGAGSIGTRHAGNLRSLGACVQHLGWRDLDLDKLRDEMRTADRAAMVIATATDVRLPLVEIAADVGAPIYLEKPAAASLQETKAIFATVGDLAMRSVVGFMMRYHPVVRWLHGLDLSDLYAFGFEIGHDVHQWRDNWSFADSYAARPGAGGVLLDLCHEIDLATLLMPAAQLSNVDCKGDERFPGIDFATRISLRNQTGQTGEVRMDYIAPRPVRRITLRGASQMRDIDLLAGSALDLVSGQTENLATEFDRNAMFIDLMKDFMALAEEREVGLHPIAPRMSEMHETCTFISRAWEARSFMNQEGAKP